MKQKKLTQIIESLTGLGLITGTVICLGVNTVAIEKVFSIHYETRAEYKTKDPVYINGVNANQPLGSMIREAMGKAWVDSKGWKKVPLFLGGAYAYATKQEKSRIIEYENRYKQKDLNKTSYQ
jgi:hypothetical protein